MKLVNLTTSNWHAQFAGGAAVNDTNPANFTNPSSAEADRVPELVLSAGGTPGAYEITGTYDSNVIKESITTVAGQTVKGTQTFDTITGPDPGAAQTLDLKMGDSWMNPPARQLMVGAAGNLRLQLLNDPAVKLINGMPAGFRDLPVKRIAPENATAANVYVIW